MRSTQLQSEAVSEQDRLLLPLSLFPTVNKSKLNLLSLGIFSEKPTAGYILLHKRVKIKGKLFRKGSYFLWVFTVFSLLDLSPADVDRLSSTWKNSSVSADARK